MNIGITELVFVFGIIVLLVLMTAMLAGVGLKMSRRVSKSSASPHEVLEIRYARGEINREQFEAMKKDLM